MPRWILAFAPLTVFVGTPVIARDRLLIVFAPRIEAAYTAQDRMLARAGAGLHERDVRIIHVLGDRVEGIPATAGALRARYAVAVEAFAVRLIGKDGHVAARSAQPIAPARLFATIDAMPMRRDEIARRRR